MSWEELIQEFLLELEILGRAKTTIKNYRSKLKHYSKYFEEKNIQPLDLTKKDLNEYILYLVSNNYQNSTINVSICRMKKLFDYAVNQEYLTKNPIQFKNRPVTKKIINVLNDDEIKRMLKVVKSHTRYKIINQRDYVIFMMLIDCGLRVSEIEHLNNDDIFENQMIIRNSKFNKDRVVAISPVLKKEILKYKRMKNSYYKNKTIDEKAFFISYQRNRLHGKSIWGTMSNIKDKSNIRDNVRFSPHTLRHTYAQMQIRNGIDIYTLSLNMGHFDVSITQKYLQSLTSEDFVEKSIKKSNLMNLK